MFSALQAVTADRVPGVDDSVEGPALLTTLPAKPGRVSPQFGQSDARTPRPLSETPMPARVLFAMLGVVCVGLGMVGVIVPGLPTTVFLLIAVWAFARSSATLERVLIHRNPLLRPFLKFLVPGAVMPRRAQVISLVLMWSAVCLSCAGMIAAATLPTELLWLIIPTVIVAAIGGSVAIAKAGRPRVPAAVS